MKVLSMVVLVGVVVATTCAPAQADTKLPFIKIENLKEGIPVQADMSQIEKQEDGVESVVIVCGVPPGGQYIVCIHAEYEDGSDCLAVFPHQGPPEFYDCDSAGW